MIRNFIREHSLSSEDIFDELTPIYKYANCDGCPSAWFFPPDGRGGLSVKPGSNLFNGFTTCASCRVKQECFDFASKHKCVGVWGGKLFTYNHKVSRIKLRGT